MPLEVTHDLRRNRLCAYIVVHADLGQQIAQMSHYFQPVRFAGELCCKFRARPPLPTLLSA